MRMLLLIILLVLSGCTTAVSAGAVYIVGKHAEGVEVKTRQYKRIDDCFMKNEQPAIELADSIVYGTPITRDYEIVLNPEREEDADPVAPHHLAYAFYIIAGKIGDMRAKGRKKWLAPYLEKGVAEDLENFIKRKYLHSYLTKCFSVPYKYKQIISPRDRARGKKYRQDRVITPLR